MLTDLDVCLIGLLSLFLIQKISYAASLAWFTGIQVAASDVAGVFLVVFWIQIFTDRLLLWVFYRAGQLDVQREGLREEVYTIAHSILDAILGG